MHLQTWTILSNAYFPSMDYVVYNPCLKSRLRYFWEIKQLHRRVLVIIEFAIYLPVPIFLIRDSSHPMKLEAT
jgi:hypothetical protein